MYVKSPVEGERSQNPPNRGRWGVHVLAAQKNTNSLACGPSVISHRGNILNTDQRGTQAAALAGLRAGLSLPPQHEAGLCCVYHEKLNMFCETRLCESHV